jgi:hypothetical protein
LGDDVFRARLSVIVTTNRYEYSASCRRHLAIPAMHAR